MLKENLNKAINELDEKYEKVLEELNHLRAEGSLSKLYNLKTAFDETFDYFFDGEDLRKKYNDWDYEEDCMLLEKTNEELLSELDVEDLEKYVEFYRDYIEQMECELKDLKYKEEQEMLDFTLSKLNELIGIGMSLSRMDNEVKEIIDAVGENGNSVFHGETEEFIEIGEYAYTVWVDEEETETRDINIKFKVIEESKNNLDVIVEVVEIELL